MIKVGCCGWAVRGGKKAYYEKFKLIELQDTFYKLPRVETAEKWRKEAPSEFEFAVKGWQVLTHPHTSPTWRKAGLKDLPGELRNYGHLKPTRENFEAWGRVKEICEALEARVCVLQTPPNFGFSEDNVRSVREFFGSIDRGGLIVGWEPRGTWREHLDAVEELCRDLKLVHVVDIFRVKPVTRGPIHYIRLHGIGPGEVNYRYKYSDEDLQQLRSWCLKLSKEGEVYVLFNNIFMAEDATRFKEMLEERQREN